jgi:dihydrofolate reductase
MKTKNFKNLNKGRSLKILALVSIDGYASSSDGSMDWVYESDKNLLERYELGSFFDSVDSVLMNRTQFLVMRTQRFRWPISDKQCYVLTGQGQPVPLDNGNPRLTLLRTDEGRNKSMLDYIRELLQTPGESSIWVMGDYRLTSALLQNNLIEEINILRLPIILGGGISFLGGNNTETSWVLEHSKCYPTGAILSTYRPTEKAQAV